MAPTEYQMLNAQRPRLSQLKPQKCMHAYRMHTVYVPLHTHVYNEIILYSGINLSGTLWFSHI